MLFKLIIAKGLGYDVRGGEQAGAEHLKQQQAPVVGSVLQREDFSTINRKHPDGECKEYLRTKSTKL